MKVDKTCTQSGHRNCKELVDTLAGRLKEMEMQTLGETLVELEAKAPVVTIFQTCQETLTQIKSEELIDRLAKRVSKWRIRQLVTHCQK